MYQNMTEEDLHPETHDPPYVIQESEMPYIKQEAEPVTSSMEEKQEDEISNFPVTVIVKSEEEEEGPSDSLFEHLTSKDLHPEMHNRAGSSEWEMPYIKEEAEPETLWMKEKEQQHEIPNFPTIVIVKSEEDEGPSEESRAVKPLSDCLFQHLTAESEGRLQPDGLLAHLSDSDDVTSLSSDFDTDEEDVDFDQNVSKFSNKSSLKRDNKDYVSEKPFDCSLCEKRFCTKQAVTGLGHTGTREKLFSCSLCDKKFNQKGNLNKHTRRHTGEKPFVCKCCGKRFFRKQELTSHMHTHTGEKPFACSVCDKRFTQKGNLNIHFRIHTGEKPFDCLLCDKRFCTKQELTSHTRTHTGEKPFPCSVCGRRFTRKGDLTNHTKTHRNLFPEHFAVEDSLARDI
ncbi:zinc finger protein 771-like [Corythoichthys intestinalis]|uniref:zinc finger protein 771-like n=1 Tax=Corythoichthys intestinalis TaxID=161448 RepID=UPI0025A670EC|nr:zinc finger protein 771-like [Corythoichthys intestinalis]